MALVTLTIGLAFLVILAVLFPRRRKMTDTHRKRNMTDTDVPEFARQVIDDMRDRFARRGLEITKVSLSESGVKVGEKQTPHAPLTVAPSKPSVSKKREPDE